MNEQNLRKLTTTEAREIGRLGGLASAESRAKKKALKECLEILLETEFEIDTTGMCDYKTVDGATAICYKLMQEALKGNIKAFLAIRDTVGEIPVTKVSVTTDVSQAVVDEIEQIVSAEM